MNQQNDTILPRRSRRLATIIPASHWISIGYSEDNAQRMELLQNDMKRYYDEDKNNVILFGRDFNGVLPHHDWILPHWKKLANRLRGRASVNIQLFRISLPVSVLEIVLPSLHSIEELRFSATQLGNDGFLKLSSFLKDNTSLKHLLIGGDDKLDDISVANSLSDAVKGHPTLDSLVFARLDLNNDILGSVLKGCGRVKELRLINTLGADEFPLMLSFICNNPITETLFLCNNWNLSDSDTLLLASSLENNTNLRQLHVRGNGITEEGEKILLKAVFDYSIIESNHTCVPLTYNINIASVIEQRPLFEQEVFKINLDEDMSIQKKIRQKLVLALCGVDGSLFDLSHFNDLSLGVMPRVLKLIQEHTTMRRSSNTPIQLEKDALTRIFHTLRCWELPLLFENLKCPSTKVAIATGKRKSRE